MVAHGPEQAQGVDHVVLIIRGRLGQRFAYLAKSGEMHHCIKTLRQHTVVQHPIAQVTVHKIVMHHGIPMPR